MQQALDVEPDGAEGIGLPISVFGLIRVNTQIRLRPNQTQFQHMPAQTLPVVILRYPLLPVVCSSDGTVWLLLVFLHVLTEGQEGQGGGEAVGVDLAVVGTAGGSGGVGADFCKLASCPMQPTLYLTSFYATSIAITSFWMSFGVHTTSSLFTRVIVSIESPSAAEAEPTREAGHSTTTRELQTRCTHPAWILAST